MLTLESRAPHAQPKSESHSIPQSRTSIQWPAGLTGYVVAIGLSVAFLFPLVKLGSADLTVPFDYQEDSLSSLAFLQNIHENTWYFQNPRLGYPFVQDFRGYPSSDGWVHLAMIKALGLAVSDVVVATNLFYLLGFPLTTATTLWALRRFGVSAPVAIVASLLYSYAPYHIWRLPHLFLASYFLWPPMAWLIVSVYQGQLPWRGRTWSSVGLALFLLAMGMGGVYYAVFGSFFLLLAATAAAWRQGGRRSLTHGLGAIALIAVGTGVTILPSALYMWGGLANPDATRRYPREAEVYGLKITELILPSQNHRAAALRDFRDQYNANAPNINESATNSMGLFASIGFLVLLGRIVLRRRDSENTLWDGLTFLCIAGLLLSTIGGFGSLVSWSGFTWIRAYNRISICLQFFAIMASALLIDRAYCWLSIKGVWGQFVAFAGLFVILGAGIWDQSPRPYPWNYHETKARFTHDRDYFQKLEATLGAGAKVLTLPNFPFPEHNEGAYNTYELLKPYLHTRTMKLSYGALRGQEGAEWAHRYAYMPLRGMVHTLAQAELTGIYLDRRAYADKGAEIDRELSKLIPLPPINSPDGNLAFYDLRPSTGHLKAHCPEGEWDIRRDRALYPILMLLRGNFTEYKVDAGVVYRSFDRGEFQVINLVNESRTMQFKFWVRPATEKTVADVEHRLIISGPLLNETHTLKAEGMWIERVIEVPPGRHRIQLAFDREGTSGKMYKLSYSEVAR